MFDEKRMSLISATERLYSSMDRKNKDLRSDIQKVSAQLTALNPLAVLSRGYGAVFNETGEVVKSVCTLEKGKNIIVKISDGNIKAKIQKIERKGDNNA